MKHKLTASVPIAVVPTDVYAAFQNNESINGSMAVFNTANLKGCLAPACKLLGHSFAWYRKAVIRAWFIRLAASPVGLLPGFYLRPIFLYQKNFNTNLIKRVPI
jgi:hypothetical protein